jgi:hypothetical protein
MAKTVGVYCNNQELEVLEQLRQKLGFKNLGAVYRESLKHLATDPPSVSPARDRVASDLKIEVPAYVRIQSMVKGCIGECRHEKEVMDKYVKDFAKTPEEAKTLRAAIIGEIKRKEALK